MEEEEEVEEEDGDWDSGIPQMEGKFKKSTKA